MNSSVQQQPTTTTTQSSSVRSEDNDEGNTNDDADVKVYVRFRPMNKLEISRRSQTCVEFPTNNNNEEFGVEEKDSNDGDVGLTSLIVDSPLEGEFQFQFDKVNEKKDSSNRFFFQFT